MYQSEFAPVFSCCDEILKLENLRNKIDAKFRNWGEQIMDSQNHFSLLDIPIYIKQIFHNILNHIYNAR